jgi:hypothetical protein
MKTLTQKLSTLEVYLQAIAQIPYVNHAAISRLPNGSRVWDSPTLWVEVPPDYAWIWSTPTGLIEVSEETTESGVLFAYRSNR